jgi:hypothetical protein
VYFLTTSSSKIVSFELGEVQHSIRANNLTISQPVPPLPMTKAFKLLNLFLIEVSSDSISFTN